MIYLSLDIDESVEDEYIQIRFDTQKFGEWFYKGAYPNILFYANVPSYNGKNLIVACNSDTLELLRGTIGGSFGIVKHFPVPVPVGVQVE